MNEHPRVQFHADFRTGRPTVIAGPVVTAAEREACTAVNRERTRGIKEATRPASPGEPFSPDGWHALVARRARQWGVPLIPLSSLGLSFDEEGFVDSAFLVRLGMGAEASAWADFANGCVYKLFELHPNYALGKRIVLVEDGERLDATVADADLFSTLEKLEILHEAGACPTEIVGIASSGDHLIVKQPLCRELEDFAADQRAAIDGMRAIIPKVSFGVKFMTVVWLRGGAWFVGDLHRRNIMRLADGSATVIDALVCPVPFRIVDEVPHLRAAADRARRWREGDASGGREDDVFAGIDDKDL